LNRCASILELHAVSKSFGAIEAVQDCSFSVTTGETMALLGPSGCGKSTLLNLIAGFHRQDRGTIRIDGRVADYQPPHLRETGMVFQHYALFPHLRVYDNIAYGLKSRRLPKREREERVHELVAMLKLEGLERRFPAELSGGQKQRVAVARALAIRPKLLLLDEAFSALDKNLREAMQVELTLLLRRLQITAIIVTHDQREAFTVADRIAVMDRGRIVQVGAPAEVYRSPSSPYVIEFLGSANRLIGEGANGSLKTDIGVALPINAKGRVQIYVRAENIKLSRGPTRVHAINPGRVELATFLGSIQRYLVACGDMAVVCETPAALDEAFRVGEQVYLDIDPSRCTLLAETGA
jgi:ABC-type Fe3+/spermidine/putrescine transport system ATPase subunit